MEREAESMSGGGGGDEIAGLKEVKQRITPTTLVVFANPSPRPPSFSQSLLAPPLRLPRHHLQPPHPPNTAESSLCTRPAPPPPSKRLAVRRTPSSLSSSCSSLRSMVAACLLERTPFQPIHSSMLLRKLHIPKL
ncbi:hypothetical protein RND81_09G047500 [Saponaria officinalis]|uniref:Uncharacterized protein n=1 Tax=Saponaria officinalis TaxID=3572 RepID=A0AAW1IIN7_SAPOF